MLLIVYQGTSVPVHRRHFSHRLSRRRKLIRFRLKHRDNSYGVLSMRMTREEILSSLDTALAEKQFVIYIQPQFNHATKQLVGGEALVRCIHPEQGMQSPVDFIPVFEDSGLIPKLDLYVFERVCEYQRKCLDEDSYTFPLSFNVSRKDLLLPDYIDSMEEIRKAYDVPVEYLRAEITESSAVMGGSEHAVEIINRFHELGYMVEMDDFGCGYSSLNALKDLEVDILKLDIKFLRGHVGGRGGIIISSVINMAKWLNTPVIAEGVETFEQADYMLSIGCEIIQGYCYSKPLPADEYHKLAVESNYMPIQKTSKFIDSLDMGRFWSPESLETLIFSNYVGGAAIFLYCPEGKSEILRVNQKYLYELGMNLSEHDVLTHEPDAFFSNHAEVETFVSTLKRAIESKKEEECETWRTITSKCCGESRLCIRSSIQLIGRMDGKYLFYIMIRNITNEKMTFNNLFTSEKILKATFDHANIYAWEYTVATKEMRPCFRCMRDLGLPPLLKNYPEPAIELGIIPPEYADLYRDWHRQIAEGVEKLEMVIPLTAGRIPFRVIYTTEFDGSHKPFKAYGSAELVTDTPDTDGNDNK